MSNTPNPLKDYFRSTKAYVQLPSADFDFYNKDVIQYPTDILRKEVGIQPMTALDELVLKDPDALLNGEAIKTIIKSCVPFVKDPSKLFINDINVLLASIRAVSMGPEMSISVACPACKVKDEYVVDLEGLSQATEKLEHEYTVEHEGLTVYVRPHTFDSHLAHLHVSFEESKLIRIFEDQDRYSDADRIKALSKAMNRISMINYEKVATSIVKIVLPDGTEVSNREHISELIKNADVKFSRAVEEVAVRISKIGLSDQTDVQCRACEHVFKESIGFNATDFFTRS